mmetsp:Transcript_47506/g.143770  ORF Transcript_47506/g.143770 Transcript_47506/m.143770 type:complete len:557 (-) Transcript_47506:38-1708(-)
MPMVNGGFGGYGAPIHRGLIVIATASLFPFIGAISAPSPAAAFAGIDGTNAPSTTVMVGSRALPLAVAASRSSATSTSLATAAGDAISSGGSSDLRVAIIGAGAAGLAAARQFQRHGVRPRVFEKDGENGGVWNYVPDDRSRPMYRGLRTNLPREVMAFREKPWGGDGGRSYVTHNEVRTYLCDYAKDYGLDDLISYGCAVTRLIVQDTDGTSCGGNAEEWPKITLRWEETRENGQCFEETFDAVCVCNGHYADPSPPTFPGLREHFGGRVMHSVEYDDPAEFDGLTVLCVGARASGSDLAREISQHAKTVYVSDADCPALVDGRPFASGNVLRVPRTVSVDERSAIHFGGGCMAAPTDIDAIILCSGYDYSFPFIDENESNLELSCVPGERRVSPMFEQLWHARVPSLAFVGLPHSVVPFPFFELQAQAIASHLCGTAPQPLPSEETRMAASLVDKESGGPKGGKVQETHFLGSFQWDYLRKTAKLTGVYDEEMENFIATNKAIYDHSGTERKGLPPGVSDIYRLTCYERDESQKSFKILASEISQVNQSSNPAR